jgi:excisionase family DNA binding protein
MMLTIKEVADRLRVSRTCVYQLVERGKLACHRIGLGRGAIRISVDDLAEFIEKCRDYREEGASVRPNPVRLKHLKQ